MVATGRLTMRAFWFAAAVLVALVTQSAIPRTAAEESASARPTLVVLGDSVLYGAQADLRRELTDDWVVRVDAVPGRSAAEAMQLMDSVVPRVQEHLVIGLGYNDLGDEAAFGRRVDAILDRVGDAGRIWWINLVEGGASRYAGYNRVIEAAASRRLNVQVLDWSTRNAELGDLTIDGIHLSEAGDRALAELVADAVDRSLDPEARCAPPDPVGASAPLWTTEQIHGWVVDLRGAVGRIGGPPTTVDPSTRRTAFAVAAPNATGALLISANGAVESRGGAPHLGDLPRPGDEERVSVVDAAAHPSGRGYWLLTDDGVVHGFGRASRHEPTRSAGTAAVALASTPTGDGYWTVDPRGAVSTFGDARFLGSADAIAPTHPVVDIAPTEMGYRLLTADGVVLDFGGAPHFGSPRGLGHCWPPIPARFAELPPHTSGYGVISRDGRVFGFGSVPHGLGVDAAGGPVRAIVAMSRAGSQKGLAATPNDPRG